MKLAKIAYDAYCKQTGGKSLISGDPLPPFEALRPAIQEAWVAAADATRDAVVDNMSALNRVGIQATRQTSEPVDA